MIDYESIDTNINRSIKKAQEEAQKELFGTADAFLQHVDHLAALRRELARQDETHPTVVEIKR